jgi:hypothetical protein
MNINLWYLQNACEYITLILSSSVYNVATKDVIKAVVESLSPEYIIT